MDNNGWIIGMQPTVPSWVSWYRRAREHGRRDPQRPRVRAPSRIALYFNTRNDPHNPYIRLDQMLGQKHLYPLPTLSTVGWRGDRLHEPFPIDVSWRVPAIPPDLGDIKTVEHPATAHAWAWGGAWRGWGGGAALLLLLVLLLRAAERCIDTKLFKIRRRESEEWPTATVMATSLQHQNSDMEHPLDNSDVTERRDLPPPYSECNKPTDEPPPPYSACYVSFSKYGQPSVQIHRNPNNIHNLGENMPNLNNENVDENRQLQNNDNFQNYDQPSTSYNIDEIRTELVFENGRVVERVTENLESNALEASIDNELDKNNVRENINGHTESSRVLVV